MSFVKASVRRVIRKYHTNDPFLIADQRNILVFHRPLGKIYGFFTSSSRGFMIYLNSNLEGPFRRFVCAHELGHAIIHPKINTPFLRQNTLFSVDRVEREANTFSVELLMPDDELAKLREMGLTIREAASQYGVPPDLATLKQFDPYNYETILKGGYTI